MNDENMLEDLEVNDGEAILGAGAAKPSQPRIDKHGTVEKIGDARDGATGTVDRARNKIEPDRPAL